MSNNAHLVQLEHAKFGSRWGWKRGCEGFVRSGGEGPRAGSELSNILPNAEKETATIKLPSLFAR